MQQLSNVHIETLQNPTLYSRDQIERACRIVASACSVRSAQVRWRSVPLLATWLSTYGGTTQKSGLRQRCMLPF